jgi:hypothetical protein
VVARYIQAIQKRDFKTVIDLTYQYQQEVAQIKAQNPQVLWPKLIGEYYKNKESTFSQEALLPSTCIWTISETRRERRANPENLQQYNQESIYVTADYPSWQDAPLIGNRLLKQTILQFTVEADAQLVLGIARVAAADVYWEEPFRILNVMWGQNPSLGDMNFTTLFTAVGGIPPFTCAIQVGRLRVNRDCYRPNYSDFYVELALKDIGTRPPFPVRVGISDGRGRQDGVVFTVPGFLPGLAGSSLYEYCWVRDPWFERGEGKPTDTHPWLNCNPPIKRLGETGSEIGGSEVGSEPPPAGGQPVAGQPSAPPAPNCGDYEACVKLGKAWLGGLNWSAALAAFQTASALDPSKPDAWAGQGFADLPLGRAADLPGLWDKALKLGGEIGFGVWHELSFHSERGIFTLSPTEVSFVNQKGQKLFGVAPAQVGALGADRILNHAFFRLRVANKNYNFDLIPLGVPCQVQVLIECPEIAIQQQSIVATYVAGTIPKLAAGAFSTAEQPLLEAPKSAPEMVTPKPPATFSPALQPAQSPAPLVAAAGCSGGTDLGYSIMADGHLYRARSAASVDGGQVPVFFDEKGSAVQDGPLLHRLELGAWTRENIVASPATRSEIANKERVLSDIIGTSQAIQRYEATQDLLARSMAEAIGAAVTGGVSLSKAVTNLVWGTVRSQLLNSPRTFFTLSAQVGLQKSLETYRQLEKLLPPADSTALDITALENVKNLYSQAQGLDLPNEALASALMPKSGLEQTNQALQSVVSELIPGLPSANESVTLDGLWKLQKSLAEAGKGQPALQKYSENFDLVANLSAADNRKIDAWATQAAQACSLDVATSSGKSMAFGYSNAEGTAILSTMAEGGTSNPTENPREFDAAICSDSTAVRVSFERYQNPGVNDNGRDWARNFDQRGGQRFRVVGGRAPADASCLLTTQAFLAGKQFLSFKQERKALACDSQTTSRLAAAGRRGVHFCRQFATAAAGEQLLAVEFDRRGNDLLAGIVLKMDDQLFVHQLPAKYDQDNVTGWRVGDQGHLFNYDQNASFLDLEVVNVFRPLFALKDEATGAIVVGIQWAGEEGLSLMLLSTSREKLEEVAKGYRYMAPL